MAKVPFLEILPGCSGMDEMCGGLQNAFITEIVINEAANAMDISAYFAQAPSSAEITALQTRIMSDYGLDHIEILASYPKELEPEKGDEAVLFGRKVKVREVTPMCDLTAKSGDVAVTGQVFFTDSREVPKHNAIVFTFEMTDYTGSVRCSHFLSTDEEKAVIGKIKDGDYVQSLVRWAITSLMMIRSWIFAMSGKPSARSAWSTPLKNTLSYIYIPVFPILMH